jgi:hypothetical protein
MLGWQLDCHPRRTPALSESCECKGKKGKGEKGKKKYEGIRMPLT